MVRTAKFDPVSLSSTLMNASVVPRGTLMTSSTAIIEANDGSTPSVGKRVDGACGEDVVLLLLSICSGLGRPKKGGWWLCSSHDKELTLGINIPHWYRINSTIPPVPPREIPLCNPEQG